MLRLNTSVFSVVALLAFVATVGAQTPAPDLTKDPTLYVVGYSHLDTQWRWMYPETIREMIPKTMHESFRYFDLYPHFIFNFSGSNRYRMMQEYYPADFARVKQFVAAGRWFPCGSSVEECDVNVTGAESIIRQVLYGNHFFRHELGTASAEFMLPDCFGFPASLPSLLAHCGLKGFSTQKLTWGSAVGIPFHVGVWEGLDGTGLVAALDAGSYNADIEDDLSADPAWLKRLNDDGKKSGVFADYHYYGVGDEGGAPREAALKWLEKSVTGEGPVHVVSGTAERMFLDLPPQKIAGLPRYKGDLLLVEHSSGSLTSAAYMKRLNRQNELLADAAERASVLAEWLGGPAYPRARLNRAWTLVMGGQFHDILPGTSHPKAYEYSWNDELLALNQFASVLDGAVGAVATALDTQAKGVALVVYNPLSIDRQDVVEASVTLSGAPDNPPQKGTGSEPNPLADVEKTDVRGAGPLLWRTAKAIRVLGPDAKEVPSQIVSADEGHVKIIFLATVPAVGLAVYDVQPAEANAAPDSQLRVSESSLENARYRITLDGQGDVAGIFDKSVGHELLSAPARLAFSSDQPRQWPAWNMDWSEAQKPPRAYVAGPAQVRIVERGPARVALEIVRDSQDSHFVQTIRLAAGDAGDRIEFANRIDWQSRACNLKAVFPLAVANPLATYNWEVGTLQRGNNEPKKYEVPAHQWFDLTDAQGDYGVTVLSNCKYGSDKPDDRTLRLTLLRTPGARGEYQDQATQDWGRHEILYGLSGHAGDWRKGQTDWQALRLQQPLIAFQTAAHNGKLGRALSLLKVSNSRVRVMAVKKAEDSDEIIVRLVELNGQPASDVHVALSAPIAAAREVDGQEQPLGDAKLVGGELVTDLAGYRLRTFALKLGAPPLQLPKPAVQTVALTYDRCVTSRDGQKTTGGIDTDGRCLPAEMLPTEIAYRGVAFKLGPDQDGQANAVSCRGQSIALPAGGFTRLYLLATAGNGNRRGTFSVDGQPVELTVQDWGGYIGQWDNRVWTGNVAEHAFDWPYPLAGVRPAYVRPDPVVWFCSHRHSPDGQNEPYAYCYLFAYALDLPAGAKTLTLPQDEKIFVLAATAVTDSSGLTHPAQPLHDELRRDDPVVARIIPAGGQFADTTSVTLERPLFGGDRTIRYTLDGSDPTATSHAFDAPFLLAQDTVVKARLFDANGHGDAVATANLQIKDVTPPAVLDVVAIALTPDVRVTFSEPLDPVSAESADHYKISGGPTVKSAALAPDGRTVTLTLSAPPPADKKLNLQIAGVRDRSPAGNAIAALERPLSGAHPLVSAAELALDGAGGGFKELPLGADAPLAAASPWTINVWLWVDKQPDDYTVIAGFGTARDEAGTQRYLAKFPHGLHFWGSNVDISAGTPLEVGKWQMLTAAFDGREVRLFKDGRALVAQEAALADAAAVAKLGPPPPWGHGHRLAGKVAGFTLWNQALLPESIATLLRLGPQATIP